MVSLPCRVSAVVVADFQVVYESMTLEEYQRREAAGEINRPLSWPPIRLRPTTPKHPEQSSVDAVWDR